jgi:hypothetical protein
MPKGTSPTQRTLKELRKRGMVCDVAEYWNQFSRRRRDLFHFVDIVALGESITGIQCTSGSNGAARKTKIATECGDAARAWLSSGGRIEVWSWRKVGQRGKRKLWEPRIEEITLADITPSGEGA